MRLSLYYISRCSVLLGHVAAWCSQPPQNATQLPFVLTAGMESNADSAFRSFLDRGGRLFLTRREVDQHKVPDRLPLEIGAGPILGRDSDLPEGLL